MDKGVAMKNKKSAYEKKKKVVFLLVFFLCSVFAILLCAFYLGDLFASGEQNKFWIWFLTATFMIGILCTVSVCCVRANKDRAVKVLFSVFVLLDFSLLVLVILQKTGFFAVVRSSENLQNYLERAGIWMPLLYIALQFLQVVLLPIPSVVSTIAGVALFGAFWTTIYSMVGIMLGSIVAFFIGRKWGNKAVSWIVGADALRKWQKKVKGRDRLILTLAFILPLFPDDILCFVAGLSTMSLGYFIVMITICRSLGIAGTCYSFDLIPFTTWWGILIWCGFALLTILAFVFLYRNFEKIQAKIRAFRRKRDDDCEKKGKI